MTEENKSDVQSIEKETEEKPIASLINKPVNVAVAFYGITRSLKHTIKSIQKNILDVLRDNNFEVDIYQHTYSLSSDYINPRAKERINAKNIDNDEYKLLNPDYFERQDQNEIKTQLKLREYRKHGDPWKSKFCSLDNYILGSYSKFRVTDMIEKNAKEYKYVFFVRPDCLYLNKLPVGSIKLADTHVVIPNFHLFGKHKMNDRFAITNKDTYIIYGKIFTRLLGLSKKHSLHSETILGLVLKSKKIKVARVKFTFARIRMNGKKNGFAKNLK